MDLLHNLNQIKQLVEQHGLCNEFWKEAQEHFVAVDNVLKVTPDQALLFALLLENSGTGDATLRGLAKALRCGKIEALRYTGDLEALELKHLIVSHDVDDDDIFCSRPSFLRKRQGQDCCAWSVPGDVIRALKAGKEYHYTIYRGLSPEEFYTAADHILRAHRKRELNSKQFFDEIKYLFGSNPDILFVKKMKSGSLTFRNSMVLLDFCATLVEQDKESQKFSDIRYLFGRSGSQDAKRDFIKGENDLFTSALLEHVCDNGLADTTEYRLTNEAIDSLLDDVDIKEKKDIKGNNIIRADSLAEKQLYYPPKVGVQIDELGRLLQEDHFSSIVKRLRESKMKTGFACLFSGPPGTGKTETAYQIARTTGRDIFFVDISETKSMWFGESEKKIKSLFTRYNAMVKHADRAPILLFNEADAVLGKRQELGSERRGPGQTENTIQNILLQEIENLDGGILIATTNMAANFDAAFERRFLYKITFEKPDLEAKAAIFKSKLPQVDMDMSALAGRFDLSGGQIENVARKAAVASLIRGNPLSAVDITALCEEELPGKETRRIGFGV
ncbi:hypothetical protein FACS189485_11040 [Spirochaetia bacterium]|nr:hypothetical protein FACS189485_11040 [Spirochaetia bacterium]